MRQVGGTAAQLAQRQRGNSQRRHAVGHHQHFAQPGNGIDRANQRRRHAEAGRVVEPEREEVEGLRMQRCREVQRGMRHQHRQQDDQQQTSGTRSRPRHRPRAAAAARATTSRRGSATPCRSRAASGRRSPCRRTSRCSSHRCEQPPQHRCRRQPGCRPRPAARLRQRPPEHHRDDDRVAVKAAVEILSVGSGRQQARRPDVEPHAAPAVSSRGR